MENLKKYLLPGILGVVVVILLYALYAQDTDTIFVLSYVLGIGAVIGVVAGFLVSAISNPQGTLRSLIGLGVLVVIFGISYAIAGSEVTALYQQFNIDESKSKMVGSFLNLTYALGFLTIGSILFASVLRVIK
ncbi:hypothetical protein [Eisenibacter elegans]|jgi:predicted small secreted protein|uniref:hypothetical protein n=1 Tax=Eisenibacter elegans TaxID=997 RepID=UPI0003FAE3B9|nr:hypothetical protein [Eisenibacter elegans]